MLSEMFLILLMWFSREAAYARTPRTPPHDHHSFPLVQLRLALLFPMLCSCTTVVPVFFPPSVVDDGEGEELSGDTFWSIAAKHQTVDEDSLMGGETIQEVSMGAESQMESNAVSRAVKEVPCGVDECIHPNKHTLVQLFLTGLTAKRRFRTS